MKGGKNDYRNSHHIPDQKIMIKKPFGFFALPFSLSCFHLVLVTFGLYKKHIWPDIPMHILGGVFIAYSFSLAVTYFQKRKILSELNVLTRSVFCFH